MKPTLRRFKEVAMKCNGNISAMASALRVNRRTIYDWIQSEESYKAIVDEFRGRLLDKCIETAELFANGVPIYIESENKAVFAGWKGLPDGNTLRYLISTLGRKEGFGEAFDVTSRGESIKPEPITIEVIDRREQIDSNNE